MRTVALRYSNSFAPEEGTIQAHQQLIDQNGFVWYGKLGSRISETVQNIIMSGKEPKVLLIHSGTADRFWAYVKEIQFTVPKADGIPEYYRNRAEDFKTWLKVVRFEKAPRDVLSHCIVVSSGKTLSLASRHSMSPYFIIEYVENAEV